MISPDLTPGAWCQRILTALIERGAEGPEAGALELLLTCLIELDPSTDEFAGLLARYAADQRLGIAEAAVELQRAWDHAAAEARRAEDLPLREKLRFVGALLDSAGVRVALARVSPERVRVETMGSERGWSLGLLELQHEIAGRRTLRGKLTPKNPTRPDRHETRLRAVGYQLDTEPPQSFEVFITPRAVIVEGDAGYYRVFDQDELGALLRHAVGERLNLTWAADADPTEFATEPLRHGVLAR